jgi:hypothetical protein
MKKHLLVILPFVLTLSANAQYNIVPVVLDSSIAKKFPENGLEKGNLQMVSQSLQIFSLT